MNNKLKIIFLAILSLTCLVSSSCAKYLTEQYFVDEIQSKPKEKLVTVLFEENIFRNNIEVFKGINETNDNLNIKHIIPKMSTLLLEPGEYTFFINSKNKNIQYLKNGKIFVKTHWDKIFFTGEAGKTYHFFQKSKGRDDSFEFQSVTD